MNNPEKDNLRAELMIRRKRMSGDQRDKLSQTVTGKCADLVDWSKVRTLHTYIGSAKLREIDTKPLLEYLWINHPHIRTYSPAMNAHGGMDELRLKSDTELHMNSMGFEEPIDGTTLSNHTYDIVVVPLLGFDRQGGRIGYGKGYYDRFLAENSQAQTIGLSASVAECKTVFPEAHDIALDWVITEKEIIDCQQVHRAYKLNPR